MTRLLKKILYKTFGQQAYLKILHTCFFIVFDLGLLKNNYLYKYHYFARHLIGEGDYVVDLGANLGYFAKIFSRLAGANGKVICIEPVKPFFQTLTWALTNKNCVLYNNALGIENKTVTMQLPMVGGYFRTGLAHVSEGAEDKADAITFDVQMVKGSSLLSGFQKINYIKCDIEGYEEFVLPELKAVIEKHKPMVQVETWGTHKDVVFSLMQQLGYIQYIVYKNKLVKNLPDGIEDGDYLFLHSSDEAEVIARLKKVNAA